MNANSRLTALFLLVAALCVTGCISHQETVYQEEPRVGVEFENETAGRIFYEALSKTERKLDRSESSTQINIPVIFEHKTRVVRGQNAAFNAAMRRCDTNHDGRITEQEARIFANQGGDNPH